MRSHRRWLPAAAVGAALALPSTAAALSLQPIGSFDQPIFVTSDPANTDRIFVVQREGPTKVIECGATSTFADLTSVVLL